MVYNKAAFAKAGLSGPPTTFEELLAACGKLKAAGLHPDRLRQPVRLAGDPLPDPAQQPSTWPPATLAKDYNPATGAFTDPGYVTALTQFQTIVKQCSNPSADGLAHEAAQANFLSGKAAMHYLELLEFPVLTPKGGAPKAVADNWSFFRLPAPARAAGDKNALTGAPDGFMVNNGSKNAALAVDFLKFMTEPGQRQEDDRADRLPQPGPRVLHGGQLDAPAAPGARRHGQGQLRTRSGWTPSPTPTSPTPTSSGAEGIANGSQTPEQVMDAVQQAAAKAKKQSS